MSQQNPNQPQDKQPQLKLTSTADYRDGYANSVQVRMSVWDFFLVFGTMSQDNPDEVNIENFQGIYLSPQQAKALLERPRPQSRSVRADLRLHHAGAASPDRRSRQLKRATPTRQLKKTGSKLPSTSLSGCSIRSSSSPSTSHTLTLLRLPYFWDEGGYYIPAAWDFFRTGTLIPQTTVTNAHPPLPSILLAAWWHLSGFVVSGTRTLVCMVAAAASARRLQTRTPWRPAAAAVTVCSPRSTRSGSRRAPLPTPTSSPPPSPSGDSPSTSNRDESADRPSRARLEYDLSRGNLFSLAALSKETAIVTPAALALWEIVLLRKNRASHHHADPTHVGHRTTAPHLAARRLVRLSLPPHRLRLRQPRVPPLQRHRQPRRSTASRSASGTASSISRAHEHVRARRLHRRRPSSCP